jgi:hypothetical protein
MIIFATLITPYVNPNVANPHRLESLGSHYSPAFGGTAALGREQFGLERLDVSSSTRLTAERLGPNGARLGQDLTYGEVHFVLTERARSNIFIHSCKWSCSSANAASAEMLARIIHEFLLAL